MRPLDRRADSFACRSYPQHGGRQATASKSSKTALSSTCSSTRLPRRSVPFTSRTFCGKRACWASASRTHCRNARAQALRFACCSTRTEAGRWAKPIERQMKEAGCKLVKFHRLHMRNIGVLNERDHRKLVVLDGRVALSAVTASSTRGSAMRRTRITSQTSASGCAVPSCTACSRRSVRTGSRRPARCSWATTCFPQLERGRRHHVHAAYVKPEGSAPAVKILHHAVICCARERIWIQNPYFIPEPDAIDAFGRGGQARRRCAGDDARRPAARTIRWCSTRGTGTSRSCCAAACACSSIRTRCCTRR